MLKIKKPDILKSRKISLPALHKEYYKKRKALFTLDVVLLLIICSTCIVIGKPTKVDGLSANSTYSTTTITWNAAENAKSYRIYRSDNGSEYKYLDYTTDTSFHDKKLRTGDTYSYAIVSKNGAFAGNPESASSIEVTPSLDTPVLEIDTNDGKINLSFQEIDGAIEYQIIRDNKVIDTIKTTSYTDESIENDRSYSYEVRAVRYIKDPVYSEKSNTVKSTLHSIQNFKIEMSGEDVVISWDKSKYFSTFKLYNGDKLLSESEDNQYTLSDYTIDETMDIRLTGYSEKNAQSPVCEKKIKVTEKKLSTEETIDAAVDWAIMIANDNSFHYGVCSDYNKKINHRANCAHNRGCYFCKTNGFKSDLILDKEKTYCCNTFVFSAYAHGGGDEYMLSECKIGRNSKTKVYEDNKHFKSLGKLNKSSLKKGDVLWYKDHWTLYIGDGEMAEAQTRDDNVRNSKKWNDSIHVTTLRTGYYKVSRYIGSGEKITTEEVKE